MATRGLTVLNGTIVTTLFKSSKLLLDVLLLMLFVLVIVALLGIQLFKGDLRRKCVLNTDPAIILTRNEWDVYVRNSYHFALHIRISLR
ncbi:hypothetical protein NDU88_005404 [Pleurodeles waltl]|uniref:Ion transport domain-containing protein n=1 Tax=Pleurodeles waltl TaxID=8319 RepID=A0AAV7WAL6_PLEWA|nr:hypothetical protein NDU88_005404 [Pleurodeles waltl]